MDLSNIYLDKKKCLPLSIYSLVKSVLSIYLDKLLVKHEIYKNVIILLSTNTGNIFFAIANKNSTFMVVRGVLNNGIVIRDSNKNHKTFNVRTKTND